MAPLPAHTRAPSRQPVAASGALNLFPHLRSRLSFSGFRAAVESFWNSADRGLSTALPILIAASPLPLLSWGSQCPPSPHSRGSLGHSAVGDPPHPSLPGPPAPALGGLCPSRRPRAGPGHAASLPLLGARGGRFCCDPISRAPPPLPHEISCPPNYIQTAAVAGISLPARGPTGRPNGAFNWQEKLAVCLEILKKGHRRDPFLKLRHTPSPYTSVSNA